MSSVDLNIVQRGLQGTEWTASHGAITANDLSKVVEQASNNSGALNALPTPFARFFVVNEAFRRVKEDPEKAGFAYQWLVSDCLDVYEILFNLKTLGVTNNVTVREWNLRDNLDDLKLKVPILGKSVETYKTSDLPNTDSLMFIVYEKNGRKVLLGTSSPYTGFITPPDLDKKKVDDKYQILGNQYSGLDLFDSNGRSYFCGLKPVLFENRSKAFKNYMYQLFAGEKIDNAYEYLRNYIRSFRNDNDIDGNYQCETEEIRTCSNNRLVVNGIEIRMDNSPEAGDYFASNIIKVPFKVSEENFITPTYEGQTPKEYDYLLPLTKDALCRLDLSDAKFTYKEGPGLVEVFVDINGLRFSKKYVSNMPRKNQGLIVDLQKYTKISFDLGLFPIIKSEDPVANNYFKIMIAASDSNDRRTFSVNDINCNFYKGNNRIEVATDDNFTSGVRPDVIRTTQNTSDVAGTKFYEIFETDFDYIQLSINYGDATNVGVIIPKWKVKSVSDKKYKYAIDFGTSNTFISAREKDNNNEPRQLAISEPIMAFLHAKDATVQKTDVHKWEDTIQPEILRAFQSEFVPTIIDGNIYKFPIRSAISLVKDPFLKGKLFDHGNIAFRYEKSLIVGNNKIDTNIKWGEEEKEIRMFIRELLLIVKCDLMLNNGKMNETEIVWFKPLSFNATNQDTYKKVWEEEISRVLGEGVKNNCYSESEAPYHYFYQKDTFTNISSVALVDIGGGSTDFVYFANNKPEFANSVYFGCDVLWGNGHNKFENAKDNGIYRKYERNILVNGNEEQKAIYSEMKAENSVYSTKDIINFWINNDSTTEISKKLIKDFKPLFLYHYTSVIYYLAQMIKSRNLDCPRAISFSGNGSRYIDKYISTDNATLVKVTMVVLKDVFGSNIKPVQLILPEERKEATCYGGLYRNADAESPEPFYFLGVDSKQYENIQEIKDAFDTELKQGLVDRVSAFNRVYVKALNELIKEENIDNINVAVVLNAIITSVEDDIERTFERKIKSMEDQRRYTDTLFFMPIIDRILELTKI